MSVGMRLCLCVVFNVAALVSLGNWVSASENVRLRQPPPWDPDYRMTPEQFVPRGGGDVPIWQSYPAASAPGVARAKPAAVIADAGVAARAVASDDPTGDEVFGLDRQQIEAVFGVPAWTVDRSPATETFFRDGRCTLRVTLYPDVQTRVFRALAYEVTSDADTVEGKRFCYDLFASRLVASK